MNTKYIFNSTLSPAKSGVQYCKLKERNTFSLSAESVISQKALQIQPCLNSF